MHNNNYGKFLMTRSNLMWPMGPRVWVSVEPQRARPRVPVHRNTAGDELGVSRPRAVHFLSQFVLLAKVDVNQPCGTTHATKVSRCTTVAVILHEYFNFRPTFHLPLAKTLKL